MSSIFPGCEKRKHLSKGSDVKFFKFPLISCSTLHAAEYLKYGVNSILFRKGIYPAETFESTQQYGLNMLMSKDHKIEEFLQKVLKQTEGCMPFGSNNRRHAWDFPSKPDGFKLGGLLMERNKRSGFEKLDQNASDEETETATNNTLTSAQFA